MSKDMVKRPDHYCFSKFEPKDVIREWGLNFNLGSAVKYIARAGRKDDIVQDLKKAREFLSFEIEALEAERGVTEEAKPEGEQEKALRFYRAFRGLVSNEVHNYFMAKRVAGEAIPEGFEMELVVGVPKDASIDEIADTITKLWEEKVNESCTGRV